jgi:hypothetical protein
MAGCRLWGMAPQERRSAGSDAAGLADWLEQTLLHAGVITTCHLLAGEGVYKKSPARGRAEGHCRLGYSCSATTESVLTGLLARLMRRLSRRL